VCLAKRAIIASALLLAALFGTPSAHAGALPPSTGVASLLIFDEDFNFIVNRTRGFSVNGPGTARVDLLAPFPGTVTVAFDPDPMVSYEFYIENDTGGRIEGALVIEIPIVGAPGGGNGYARMDAQAVDVAGVDLEAQHLPILVDVDASPSKQDTFLTNLALNVGTGSTTLIRETAGPETIPGAPGGGQYDRFAVQLSFSLEAGDSGVFGGAASFPNPVGACDDFLDNDGDGLADHAGGDPGCDSSWDSTERVVGQPCDDGFDDDGDGLIDVAFDPGCKDADSATESPQCQDGIDNEGDGLIDFDGGVSAGVPGPQQTAPDPHCESGGALVGWLDQEQGTTPTTTTTTTPPTTTTTTPPTTTTLATTTTTPPTTTTIATTTTTTITTTTTTAVPPPTTTTTPAPTTTTAPPPTTSTTTTLPTGPQVFELRITNGSDDAEEKPTGGGVILGSSDLEMVTDGSTQTVGLRFDGVTIPRGASIVGAWIQFQVDEATSGPTNLTIRGEKVGHALPFLTSTGNLSNRADTNAFVSWSPPAWSIVGEQGAAQRTPSLTGIVREIVSGPGWASGNAMVFTIDGSGERVAEAADGDVTGAPLLHVVYDTTARPPRPTVFCGFGPELAPLLGLLGLARRGRSRRS
jgi:hypothetical protein